MDTWYVRMVDASRCAPCVEGAVFAHTKSKGTGVKNVVVSQVKQPGASTGNKNPGARNAEEEEFALMGALNGGAPSVNTNK
jgi:hypothetical protein